MRRNRLAAALTSALSLCVLAANAFAAPFVSEYGYRITPPKGWTVDTSGQPGIDLLFIAPPVDKFAANLNVIITQSPGATNMDALMKDILAGNKVAMQQYKVIKKGPMQVGNAKGLNIVGTHMFGSPARRLWIRQVVLIRDERAYILTCTAIDSKRATYEPLFSTMLKTFQWTPAATQDTPDAAAPAG